MVSLSDWANLPASALVNCLMCSLTPVQTILDAYRLFLDDTTGMVGELLECSVDKMLFYKPQEMANGRFTKRAVTVWEPLFTQMHGEDSGLPDAIP